MNHEFTPRERTLLGVFFLIVVGIIYFLAVDQPVRNGIAAAQTEAAAMQEQVDAVNEKVKAIENIRQELKEMEASGQSKTRMPSYNAGKEEVDFMNDTLKDTIDYYIGFNDLTREGDQIRRNFSLQFKAANYKAAQKVLKNIEGSKIRCLIGDISVSPAENDQTISDGEVQVSCTATFYETLQGGKADKELPPDSLAAQEAAEETTAE